MTLRTLGVFLALSLTAYPSQAASTGVHGRVTDPGGLPLPGVTVTLSTIDESGGNASTAAASVTDQNGDYSFEVPAGQYALTLELSSFQAAKRVVIVQSDVITVDVSLALA